LIKKKIIFYSGIERPNLDDGKKSLNALKQIKVYQRRFGNPPKNLKKLFVVIQFLLTK